MGIVNGVTNSHFDLQLGFLNSPPSEKGLTPMSEGPANAKHAVVVVESKQRFLKMAINSQFRLALQKELTIF